MEESAGVSHRYRQMIVEALEYIESHLDQPISIKEITSKVESSHWHFQRMFRNAVGLSVGQYLRQRRLTQSIELLKETNLRVLDIAIRFNFGSQEAFARAFKQHFGITPTECRTGHVVPDTKLRAPLEPEKLSTASCQTE